MMKNIHSSIGEVELILYIIDIQDKPGEEENKMLEIIKNSKIKFLVLINKVDLKNTKIKEIIQFLKEKGIEDNNIIKISAEKKINTEELKNKIYENFSEGPLYYPQEYYTDQEINFRISEIIREKAIENLKEELPYSLYVDIDTLENKKRSLFIRANIFVANESQKGIIVGKNGKEIKSIGERARKTIAKIFETKCNLFLQVKLKKIGTKKTN